MRDIQLLEFPPDINDQIQRHQTFSYCNITQEGRRVSKLWIFTMSLKSVCETIFFAK